MTGMVSSRLSCANRLARDEYSLPAGEASQKQRARANLKGRIRGCPRFVHSLSFGRQHHLHCPAMELSKRDYFAAKALAGILGQAARDENGAPDYEKTATEAFHYADAMMKHSRTLHNPIEIDPEQLSKAEAKAGH
jgi:hypothetical protein